MADSNRLNIIIAGAGAAGLSLLWRILNSPVLEDQRILLIDQSFKPAADKTWCFWENLELPEPDLLYYSWNKLRVTINRKTYSEVLHRYRYRCLKSDDFAESVLKKAERNQQVTLLKADIHDFTGEENKGIVHTSEGDFEAAHIFQSVKEPPGFDNLQADISLVQHFLGWETESSRNVFDPETATFMDFDIPQKNGLRFMYLLPFSKNKALVEYTIFSKQILNKMEYETEISGYLKSRYNLQEDKFSIKRKESGIIPMNDRIYPARFCNHVWNIGLIGGLAKPSTGYTFSRIQKHSSKIVEALENRSPLPGNQLSAFRFHVYDLMMLYILEKEPKNSLQVFEHLFSKNSFDRVLRFLAEQTNPLQELSIFSGMPYIMFFRSFCKMRRQIFKALSFKNF